MEGIDSLLVILMLGNWKHSYFPLKIVKQKRVERKHIARKIRIFLWLARSKDVDSASKNC